MINTEIKNALLAADDKAKYDECAKNILKEKRIMAHILANTVNEFLGMDPKDVEPYIEGDIYVDTIPIEPGLTNIKKKNSKIIGFNTEDVVKDEGLVRFDLIFNVRSKDGIKQILINIEIQKDEPSNYHILNRAQFYTCRMVSSQKGRDFEGMNYDDIKSVSSIWLCMDRKENSLTHYHFIKEDRLKPYDWGGNLDMIKIILLGIKSEEPNPDNSYTLHRLLASIFSEKLKVNEKFSIMEEYDIPLTETLQKGIQNMCNLGQGIEDRATARGIEIGTEKGIEIGTEKGIEIGTEKGIEIGIENATVKFVVNMYANGIPIEQIIKISNLDLENIKTILEKNDVH